MRKMRTGGKQEKVCIKKKERIAQDVAEQTNSLIHRKHNGDTHLDGSMPDAIKSATIKYARKRTVTETGDKEVKVSR